MSTVNIKINGYDYTMKKGITILDASFETLKMQREFMQQSIPTLYYLKGVQDVDQSGVCIAEVDGEIVNASTTRIKEGMEIQTRTPTVMEARKKALAAILEQHNKSCLYCFRSTSCELQDLLKEYGFTDEPDLPKTNLEQLDLSSKVLIRDNNKCIKCKRCINVCAKMQAVSAIACTGDGLDAKIEPASPAGLAAASCVNCGQCRVYCPTGAIAIKTHMDEAWEALADPNVRVVAQIAPAVRVAVGDHYGLTKGKSVMGKIVNALHRMGFDEVYDTSFSADLTIMEESAEFLDRIKKGEKLPLLTSCCPAWVKFITDQYKDYIPNLSTCRSPQGMLSAVIKEYFRDPEHAGGKKTVMISIMPCTAKKAEAVRPNSFTDGEQDTDIVITTTELLRMIDNFGLDFATLDPEACDMPFGFGSGGGVIFGVTGGVTEAVLRRLTPDHSKETMHEIAECGVRGDEGIKEFTVRYEGMNLNICVASGLANAKTVMEQVKNGEKEYHLIEIMACRRGCIMGGGQPTRSGDRTKALRAKGLYNADNTTIIKKSDENPLVLELYNGLLKGKEHHLLHNDSY